VAYDPSGVWWRVRARRIAGWTVAVAFATIVVHASAANQCPAGAMGACARVHAELMRPRSVPVTLAAPPMRAASERG
jgi:hypothetical protein